MSKKKEESPKELLRKSAPAKGRLLTEFSAQKSFFKDREKTVIAKTDGSGISVPYNVIRTAHVTPDFSWEVANAQDVISLEKAIGKG